MSPLRVRLAGLVLSCALGAAPALAGQPLFNSDWLFYPVPNSNTRGWQTAAADLDNDGYSELISAHLGTGLSVAIWRGSPAGLQRPANSYAIRSAPAENYSNPIRPADVDGDGWIDLVVTAIDSAYVLRNLQDGTFASPVRLFVPGLKEGLASVGDLNGDGHADIALPIAASEVRLFFGDGAFGFTPGPKLKAHLWPYFNEIRDFDENGIPDLMIGARDTSQVFLGQGGGAFAAQDFLGELSVAADLDADGHVDLVSATAVMLGNGNGTFQLPIAHGVEAACQVADLDSDGYVELIGLPVDLLSLSRVVTVARGLGHGLFGPVQPYLRYSESWGVPAPADYDGDGRVDLSMSAYTEGFTYVMRGLGDGRFESAPWIATTAIPRQVAVGRLDEGTSTDLVVASRAIPVEPYRIRTWVAGGGGFAAKDSSDALTHVSALGAFDANGDGLDDIVAGYFNLATYSVWLTQPGGTLGPRADYSLPAGGAMAFGDVDLDGFKDILFSTFNGTPQTRVYLSNHNGTFTASPALAELTTRLFVADMNADGLPDLVGGIPWPGYGLRILYATDLGVYGGAPTDYAGPAAPCIVVRLDSDALPDVLTSISANTLALSWYRNQGGGSFAAPVSIDASVIEPHTAGDFDGDGVLDLARRTAGGASVWINNGDGTYQPALGFGALPGGTQFNVPILAADVDGDSHPDLLVGAYGYVATVSVLINQTGKPVLGTPPSGPPTTGRWIALSVRPNPARGRITASLAFDGAAAATLEMFDVRGRRVLRRQLAPGAAHREVDLGDGHTFPPGLYFLTVRSAGVVAKARLCIVR